MTYNIKCKHDLNKGKKPTLHVLSKKRNRKLINKLYKKYKLENKITEKHIIPMHAGSCFRTLVSKHF